MSSRQTRHRQARPRQWLIVADRPDDELWRSIRRVPPGTGILLLARLSARERRRLRHLARSRRLEITEEVKGDAARVHDARELRRALLKRTPMIFLSPVHPTSSHPDWQPVPPMRAAALARLGNRNLFALGGMDQRRYAKIAQLGFTGWAGISAFRI